MKWSREVKKPSVRKFASRQKQERFAATLIVVSGAIIVFLLAVGAVVYMAVEGRKYQLALEQEKGDVALTAYHSR